MVYTSNRHGWHRGDGYTNGKGPEIVLVGRAAAQIELGSTVPVALAECFPRQGTCPTKAIPGLLSFWRVTGATPVPESDSGLHEKRYCCQGPERPHRGVAKIAPLARKAVGCHSSALDQLIEGNPAKAGCA